MRSPVAEETEVRKRKTRRVDGVEAEVETTKVVVSEALRGGDLAGLGRVAGRLPTQKRTSRTVRTLDDPVDRLQKSQFNRY